MARQFLRKASLILSDDSQGLDMSAMQFTFKVTQADLQTPNRAIIRVYNLSDATAQRVQKEFTKVLLQGGYQDGPFGVLHAGTIVQVRRGRENGTDTYLDLTCADGDEAANFATVNTSIKAGSSFQDRVDALAKAMKVHGVTPGYVQPGTDAAAAAKMPRGMVYWGMVRDHLRVEAANAGSSYSVLNGQLNMIPLAGYRPGEAAVISPETGLIGVPEQSDRGVEAKCLLNPLLTIGSLVQIDQSLIRLREASVSFTSDATANQVPGTASDGFYKLFVVEHEGDTRGQQWYTTMTALGVDPSSNPTYSSLFSQGGA